MNEENEKFPKRFENIEQTLKYIADMQAKAEWQHKQDQIERRKLKAERRKFEEESRKSWQQTKKQFDYLAKLTGIAFEDLTFQDEKLNNAAEALSRKNPERI